MDGWMNKTSIGVRYGKTCPKLTKPRKMTLHFFSAYLATADLESKPQNLPDEHSIILVLELSEPLV